MNCSTVHHSYVALSSILWTLLTIMVDSWNSSWFETSFGESLDALYGELSKSPRCFKSPLPQWRNGLDAIDEIVCFKYLGIADSTSLPLLMTLVILPEVSKATRKIPKVPTCITSDIKRMEMGFTFSIGNTLESRRYKLIGEVKVPKEEAESPYSYEDGAEVWKRGLLHVAVDISRCIEQEKVCQDQYAAYESKKMMREQDYPWMVWNIPHDDTPCSEARRSSRRKGL